MLSTRLGTLLLCGALSFTWNFPYINKFSSLCLEDREKVLQKWFKHCLFTPIRIAFIYVKVMCLYIFFSRVFNLLPTHSHIMHMIFSFFILYFHLCKFQLFQEAANFSCTYIFFNITLTAYMCLHMFPIISQHSNLSYNKMLFWMLYRGESKH